jgi:gas vesicle protein
MRKFFLFFAVLCKLGDSVDIRCNYQTDSWIAVDSVYECIPQNTLNIKSRESAVINSNNGSHLSGMSNSDVAGFYSSGSSRVIEYFPRNLENIFTNLKMIWIWYGRLKEIQQSDLRPFSKLVRLNLEYNDIEFLEDGLFAYNPELAYVGFQSNKKIHIGSQVFDNLNKLSWLYLGGNTCINMNAGNNQTAVKEVISQARPCQQYSNKPELSKSLTDLSNEFEKKLKQVTTDLDEKVLKLTSTTSTKLETKITSLEEKVNNLTINLQDLIENLNNKIAENTTNDDFIKMIVISSSLIMCLVFAVLIKKNYVKGSGLLSWMSYDSTRKQSIKPQNSLDLQIIVESEPTASSANCKDTSQSSDFTDLDKEEKIFKQKYKTAIKITDCPLN